MLDPALEKYLHLCAMSLATLPTSIPFPDGSYYHLIIFYILEHVLMPPYEKDILEEL